MVLPKRKIVRLSEFDYSTPGFYFITICTFHKKLVFGLVQDGRVLLNHCGEIATDHLVLVQHHIENVFIDKYVVMPNHIHMILQIVEAGKEQPKSVRLHSQKSTQIVPKVVQMYKASVTRSLGMSGLWQRSYYEHVIRNEVDYSRIWEYIDTNPIKWEMDAYYSNYLDA